MSTAGAAVRLMLGGLTVVGVMIAGGAGLAEPDAETPSLGGLPPLTVRPSGFEDLGAEAQARQQRLLSRMQRNEFVFRSICRQCGTSAIEAAPGAPFRPVDALASRARATPDAPSKRADALPVPTPPTTGPDQLPPAD